MGIENNISVLQVRLYMRSLQCTVNFFSSFLITNPFIGIALLILIDYVTFRVLKHEPPAILFITIHLSSATSYNPPYYYTATLYFPSIGFRV